MPASPSARAARDSLEWLTTDRLLELIAHDINNICHGALSYVDLALDPKQTPEARAKFLSTAKQLTHRASRFAPHLHLLNELRAADLTDAPSEPLAKAIGDARAAAMELNFSAPLELEKTGGAWQRRVVGGKYLTPALAHLLDNAIRFQRPGGTAKVVADARVDGAFIRITLRDNGKGFPKGADAYAAKRFSQVGSVSGVGLGLAFARILAERAGGGFEVANALAEKQPAGAVITLRLPAVAEP